MNELPLKSRLSRDFRSQWMQSSLHGSRIENCTNWSAKDACC